ncbi:hypothetical protein M9458_052559 [Cirrhinus mrigala]|uniref:Immunoglobulin V-set domain-containing protein n=1 Tax=Cirrhinus mrigala TaxID=683832 RepID=A0ABD0MSI1_CIRMR
MFCQICREYTKEKNKTNSFVVGTSNFKIEAVKDHEKARSHQESLQITFCASNGDTITAEKTEEFAAEGSNGRISCSYSSALSLLWYRQYDGSAPEFLVLIVDSAKETQMSHVDYRLTTNVRKIEKQNHVDLEISSAAVSDSALYYCPLRPTVTGNTSALYKNLTQLLSTNQTGAHKNQENHFLNLPTQTLRAKV